MSGLLVECPHYGKCGNQADWGLLRDGVMKWKRSIFDDIYTGTKINPDDVIYKKGVERPSDKEIIKEVESRRWENDRVIIYRLVTFIVWLACIAIFKGRLSRMTWWGLLVGVIIVLTFLDRQITRYLKKSKKSKNDRIPR